MDIDALPLVYYGLICAMLAGFTPRLIGLTGRVILGGIVGIAAAFWMPEVQSQFTAFTGW